MMKINKEGQVSNAIEMKTLKSLIEDSTSKTYSDRLVDKNA